MSVADPPPDEEELDAVEQSKQENKAIKELDEPKKRVGKTLETPRHSKKNLGKPLDDAGKGLEKLRKSLDKALETEESQNHIGNQGGSNSKPAPTKSQADSKPVLTKVQADSKRDVGKSKRVQASSNEPPSDEKVAEVCYRHFVGKEEPQDIAKDTGIPQSTVYYYLARNREAWKDKSQPSGSTGQLVKPIEVQTDAKGDGGIAPDEERERVREIIIERGTIIIHKVGLNPKMSLAFDWVRNNRKYEGDIGDFINHLLDFWLDACKLDIGVIKKA